MPARLLCVKGAKSQFAETEKTHLGKMGYHLAGKNNKLNYKNLLRETVLRSEQIDGPSQQMSGMVWDWKLQRPRKVG